ncbi:MAG: polyprenyl diphosphate synthase [Dehalococcoidales bacterium]|nr:polyprenyl diphosphate synthase [Dehalococcoidales bacterium]
MENTTGLPRHVAIILDGNGRWAEKRGLPRLDGHRAGVQNVHPIISHLNTCGITHATLYTFSTENWKRPEEEVNGLLKLLRGIIREEARQLHKNDVIIRHIGSEEGIDGNLLKPIQRAAQLTAKNSGMHLGMAFNYGGRMEILDAVKKFIKSGADADSLDEATFTSHLYTAGFPEVDLVIRTGGEFRTSNFLIWQAAYAEYYFTPVLWPDFNEEELEKALQDYGQRQRRFGGLSPGE